jgi:hypothetical protein
MSEIKNKEYLKQFFVGLLEGDGSIQVNHWRSKSLQFRLIIKLKNLPSNYDMLILIAKVVGGQVRYTNKEKFVIWVVNDKEEISRIIKLFDKYPLLTARKICQLRFFKNCLKNPNIDEYFTTKDDKYLDLKAIILNKPFNKVLKLEYFKIWLIGFIEAEGCFSLRQNNNHSFSISQKNEQYLIEAIRVQLNASNKVRKVKENVYILEIYKIDTLLAIRELIKDYPLIGEKKESYLKFFEHDKFQ